MTRAPGSTDTTFLAFAGGSIGLTLALRFGLGWPWIAAWLAAASLATVVLYGIDKRAAQRGTWRVPEVVLHAFALAGGSPGALVGQTVWRHKTRKLSFQIVFWTIVVVQLAVLGLVWTGKIG